MSTSAFTPHRDQAHWPPSPPPQLQGGQLGPVQAGHTQVLAPLDGAPLPPDDEPPPPLAGPPLAQPQLHGAQFGPAHAGQAQPQVPPCTQPASELPWQV